MKAIRDRVPQYGDRRYGILYGSAYKTLLVEKLAEEADEVKEAYEKHARDLMIEELGDLLEVMCALAPFSEIADAREKKFADRGGFVRQRVIV
jgi:predicted house-cleaning noncanonical NTP pyrophosphatase (MazG superfamily)